jgi:predicted Zn-dependent protease
MVTSNVTSSLLIVLFLFILTTSSITTAIVHAKTSLNETKTQESQGAPDNGQDVGSQNQNQNPSATQTPRNHPPKADAGNNEIVRESENVVLDGSNSIDPDGDKLSYSWQLVSPKNIKISLHNDDTAKPDFVAPGLTGASNKLALAFKLTVSDGQLQSNDIVQILVTGDSNTEPDKNKIKTLTVIDTGEQPKTSQFFASDVCGAGTYQYSYLVSGVKWRTFPVTYAIDATNSHIDANAAKAAVRKAFAAYDALNNPAGTFFLETSSYSAAKIKVTWKYIDGPFNRLGSTSISYRTDTKALTSATVTFDSGDKYFVSSTERCGMSGSLFDVQNIATHEIGHAINLGHVSDKLQSMYPTAFAGETLKRTLGNGDKLGETRLY